LLAAAFLVGMGGVVYMSLQGNEIKVPEIVGKDFNQSEKELTDLGLRIKRRADRFSEEKPNTILEQLPKPGDTVKTGQMILVVTSKANPEGEELPATIKKSTEAEETEKIEELISDKPKKKTNTATNSNKKKSSTTRDVLSNNSNSNSNSNSSNTNSTNTNKSTTNKPTNSTDTKKPTDTTKPPANKTPTSGDTRQRKTP
jgi:beta-lactam-binding protein with PASTA domain